MARFLSLDWDRGQLHVVAATIRRGTVSIQRAALWEEDSSPNAANAEQMGQQLRSRLKEAGFPNGHVIVSLGRDGVILKELRIPPMPAEEEPNVVRFQAVKEISDSPDSVVIDYVHVGEANGQRRVLALIARKELVETYRKLCTAAGLKLAAVLPRSFGLAMCIRSVMGTTAITPMPEPEDAPYAVITVGDSWSEMCVVHGKSVLLARPLSSGPAMAGEIRRNLAVYSGQAGNSPVRALYVTGTPGPELRQKLMDMLDLPIHMFDPFAGIDSLHVPPPPRGTFAGAVGVLHAQAETGKPPINFLKPRQPEAKKDPNRLKILMAVGLGIILLAAGAVYARMQYEAKQRELFALNAQKRTIDSDLNKVKGENKRLEGLHGWDTPVWLDEIYDLTHRIPNVDELRITSISMGPSSKNKKNLYEARAVLKGRLYSRRDKRKPLNDLVKEFIKDGSYSVQAPQVSGDNFTLVVNVRKRGPGSYTREIPVKKKDPEPKGEGDPKGDPMGTPEKPSGESPDDPKNGQPAS